MSIRSSSRKNKGQNKYLEEILKDEDSYYTLNNTNNGNTETEIVKCIVCQTTDENYDELTDSGGDMIQCDKCDTWQHIKCMTGGHDDITPFLTVDSKYYCSICDPERYPHLVTYNNLKFTQTANSKDVDINTLNTLNNLSSLDNFEILENNDNNYPDFQHEEENFDDHNIIENNDDEDFRIINNPNSDDFIDDELVKDAKKRKISKNNSNSNKGLKKKASDSNETKIRDNAIKMFNDLFLKFIIPEVVSINKYTLPEGENIKAIAKSLAQDLEIELFKANSNPTTLKIDKYYTEKVRSLYSNLKDKKNVELKCHVLNKVIPFEKLVKMTSSELANPDLQNFKQKVDTELLNQLVIDLPEKPLYVKTHKGEELLAANYEEQQEDSIYSMSNIHRLSVDEEEKTEEKIDENNDNKVIPNSDKENTEAEALPYSEKLADVLKSMKHLEETARMTSGTQYDSEEIKQIYNDNSNFQNGNEPLNHNSVITKSTFKIKSNILYSEFNINFKSKLTYIACTNRRVKNPYREALSDGSLKVEGRLAVDKAYSYLKQVKGSRNILLYYMNIPESKDDIDSFNNLADLIIFNNKALGATVKRPYEKNIYIIAADSGEYPSIIEDLYDISTTDFSEVEFSEQKIFVLVVVKTELIR